MASVQFLVSNPAAATLFEVVTIPPEDIAAKTLRMRTGESTNEKVRRHTEA